MSIAAVVAGSYSGTWNSVALQYTRQGFTLHWNLKVERVEESDLYGLSLIDLIYRGAQVMVDCIGKVYGAGVTGPLAAWTGTFGTVYSAASPIGQLGSGIAKALVLTAVANTPAATAGNIATFTAALTMIRADNDFQLILDSRGRDVPLSWDVLLKDTAGTGTFFATT